MRRYIILAIIPLVLSCNAGRTGRIDMAAHAPVIIYKTKADYFHNVPIVLNKEKDRVVSYPAPSDLKVNGEFLTPVKLVKGFLLDRRGVNENTVFTSLTYETYSKLVSAPSTEELLESVIDTEPFICIYNCGKRSEYESLVKEINRIIRGGLKECEKLK